MPKKPYTLRWFLQLVPYSYRLNEWGAVKGFRYLVLCYARVRFWYFPARRHFLKAKYKKRYRVGYREYYYQKWLRCPLPMFPRYGRGEGADRFFTLAAYTGLLEWLLDMFLYATLGFGIIQRTNPLFHVINVLAISIIAHITDLYLSWGVQEYAYTKDFEHRFSARQKFFIWLFFCFPVVGIWLLCVLFILLIILLMLFK